jgi:hypothetical protein
MKTLSDKMGPGGVGDWREPSLSARLWYNLEVNLTHKGPWARFLLVNAQAQTRVIY